MPSFEIVSLEPYLDEPTLAKHIYIIMINTKCPKYNEIPILNTFYSCNGPKIRSWNSGWKGQIHDLSRSITSILQDIFLVTQLIRRIGKKNEFDSVKTSWKRVKNSKFWSKIFYLRSSAKPHNCFAQIISSKGYLPIRKDSVNFLQFLMIMTRYAFCTFALDWSHYSFTVSDCRKRGIEQISTGRAICSCIHNLILLKQQLSI